jgi:hypothetical protein
MVPIPHQGRERVSPLEGSTEPSSRHIVSLFIRPDTI